MSTNLLDLECSEGIILSKTTCFIIPFIGARRIHGRAFEGLALCKLYWKKVQQNGRQLWRPRQKLRFLLWKFGLTLIQFTSLDCKQGAFMSFLCKLFSIPSSHTLTVPGRIKREFSQQNFNFMIFFSVWTRGQIFV
jgi:hypothetical protein